MPRDDVFLTVQKLLRAAGFSFRPEASVGGIPADFAFLSPDGRLVVVETKTWDKVTKDLIDDAARQAKYFETAGGADKAFVVVRALPPKVNVPSSVTDIANVIAVLQREFHAKRKAKPKQRKTGATVKKTVFAAMPFDKSYDDVHAIAMSHAAEFVGAKCVRVDREMFSGDIISMIYKMIKDAIAVIVDLSEAKPNVLYEAGFAHALRKPIIHICSTPLQKMPFDVSHWRTLPYSPGQINAFKDTLAENLKAIVTPRKPKTSKKGRKRSAA